MMQRIRDRAQGVLAWFLVLLISAVFILWGVERYLGGAKRDAAVAKVDDHVISVSVFKRHWNAEKRAHPTADDALLHQLKADLLTRLIDEAVLSNTLETLHLTVTEPELAAYVKTVPLFQDKGVFSETAFQNALRRMQLSPELFFARLKQEWTARLLQAGLEKTSIVSEPQMQQQAAVWHQTRDFDYRILKPQDITAAYTPSEKEMRAYYAAHSDHFMRPHRVKVAYLLLDFDALKKTLKLTEAQKAEALHMMQGKKVTKQKALAAFKASEAQRIFAERTEQLTDLTYAHAETLEPAAKALGLSVQTSDWIVPLKEEGDSEDDFQGLEHESAIQKAAFSSDVLQAHYNSAVLTLSKGRVAVMRVLEEKPAAVRSFDDVRASIAKRLHEVFSEKRLMKQASRWVQTLQSGDAVSWPQGVQVHAVKGMTREGKASVPEAIVTHVFSMSAKPAYTQFQLDNGFVVLIHLKAVYVREWSKLSSAEQHDWKQASQESLGRLAFQTYLQAKKTQMTIKRFQTA